MEAKKKKYLIITSLVVFSLLVVGLIFFFWWKNPSNSEKKFDPRGEFGSEYRDPESGYSTWKIIFPPGSSEERAKQEFVDYVWHHGAYVNSQNKQEVEKQLIKDASRLNFSEIREWEKEFSPDLLDEENIWEKAWQKYHEKAFFYLPDSQSKFEKGVKEAQAKLFILGYSADCLELKPNGEIDWIASLNVLMHGRPGIKKTNLKKNQATFQKLSDYIAGQNKESINVQLLINGNQFPNLTTLKELNEWVNTLAKLLEKGQYLFYRRWRIAKKLGKKCGRLLESPKGDDKYHYKNQKLNLDYQLLCFSINS